jgi:fluoroquinolone resistance protein
MSTEYIHKKEFVNIDYSTLAHIPCEYEQCTFINCRFTGADISGDGFDNCVFEGCDLSNTKLVQTTFREVWFRNCKMLGLHFDDCNDFLLSFSFEGCQLNMSVFYKLNLKKTHFKKCNLLEVDFTNTNLTNAVFEECELSGATFDNTMLDGADLRTAYNFTINPENNHIKKAMFSLHGLPGLLDKYKLIIE